MSLELRRRFAVALLGPGLLVRLGKLGVLCQQGFAQSRDSVVFHFSRRDVGFHAIEFRQAAHCKLAALLALPFGVLAFESSNFFLAWRLAAAKSGHESSLAGGLWRCGRRRRLAFRRFRRQWRIVSQNVRRDAAAVLLVEALSETRIASQGGNVLRGRQSRWRRRPTHRRVGRGHLS